MKKKEYKDWKEFDETDKDKFVYHVRFDAEIPHMEVCSSTDFDYLVLYRLPEQLAYYCATHQGWTDEGRKRKIEQGRRELQNELKLLLGIK